ncbi:MAG: endonuclease/exonuclease/phosphatase family protein, partial [Clostridia bacterium]|nr:endonuclease/exonuclease/phosphatase family protein [Clostridia bacterium]
QKPSEPSTQTPPVNQPADQDKPGKDEGSKPSDDEPADEEPDEDIWEEEPEDPYENTPISKTPAKTEDGVSYYKENKLKVVSYNIRCANDPNGNSIEERAPRLMEVLDKYDPDLIGFQEYVIQWEEPTYFGLSDEYDSVLKYRSATNSEGTPIYFKKSKFKLLDEGHFWLSETPEKESKGWGADYWRICSWVKLQIRQTGKVIFFFNTHFDFKDEPQVNSAKLLIKQATDICKGAPMIVSADYNMTWKSKGYAEMTKFFTDVNVGRDETKTYTGYRDPASSLIDFIFVTGKNIKPVAYNVMNEKPGGKFVSDHFGVYSEIIIL